MNANGAPLGSAPGLNCETATGDRVRDAAPARKPGNKTDRRSPRRRPTLEAPVEIAKFSKGRFGQAAIVSLNPYKGHLLLDIRTWLPASDGRLQPGKGFSCAIKHLHELARALARAEVKAIELGLIDGGEAV